MPEEKEPTPETTAQGEQPTEATAPKPEPKGPTWERLGELEKLYQSRESKANKEAAEARRETEAVRQRVADLESQLEEAKLYGDDEQAKTAHRRLREARTALEEKSRQVEEREGRLRAAEKAMAVWALANRYGVPEETLLKCESAQEMEVTALRWALDNSQGAEKGAEKAKAKPAPESGEQRVPRKSYAAMTSEEFKKETERLKRQAAQKAAR